MFLERHLTSVAFSEEFGRQMRLIVGPRQAGKTILARQFLKAHDSEPLYFNWDTFPVKAAFKADPHFYWASAAENRKPRQHPWVCFDEIHKVKKWKNILKDAFDSYEDSLRFIVTGSAKLDVFRKAGDSLAGRYLVFRLNPLSLREVASHVNSVLPSRQETAESWIGRQIHRPAAPPEALASLLTFGPFPEPFARHSKAFYQRWSQNYLDRLVREDIRDWTQVMDFQQMSTLADLLPSKVGAPLSIHSLQDNLQMNHATVKRYLQILGDFFVSFSLSPYTHKIARSLTKEKKVYLFDYARIIDPGYRFENLVALELKILTNLWTDAGQGAFELHYVRTRDGKETDFLLTRDRHPWLLVEAKFGEASLANHHFVHRKQLGSIPLLQICRREGVLRHVEDTVYVVSANRIL